MIIRKEVSMNRKNIISGLAIAALVVCMSSATAFAGGWGKGGMCRKDGLDDKIYYKAKFMLMNEEELDLSDKQVDTIKDIKMATKREMVKKKAEIGLVKLDIKEKLYEDKVDPAAIDPLIDKKYDLKKAKAKYLVGQYAELKDVLTEKQKDQMKSLWRASCKK